MTLQFSENLAALIGSRICHDLISPIGAVNNGLELLALSGSPQGPEMSLVTESAQNANARIALFRLAFGLTADGQMSRAGEISRVWSQAMTERNLTLHWQARDSLPRAEAQALVLALLCLDTAFPQGGETHVSEEGREWHLTASGPAMRFDERHWSVLSGAPSNGEIAPSHVQFLLLPQCLAALGKRCAVHVQPQAISFRF